MAVVFADDLLDLLVVVLVEVQALYREFLQLFLSGYCLVLVLKQISLDIQLLNSLVQLDQFLEIKRVLFEGEFFDVAN